MQRFWRNLSSNKRLHELQKTVVRKLSSTRTENRSPVAVVKMYLLKNLAEY